mgnify:CR=1 FL=1
MKAKKSKKKQKGIAERKTEVKRKHEIPYQALGLGILLWVIITWLFFGYGIVRTPVLAEGQTASSTIVASVDFECENILETAFNRTKVESAISPVFSIDSDPSEQALKKMEIICDRMMHYLSLIHI